MIRSGPRTVPHFAHYRRSTCVHNEGEGGYHENGKIQLYQWLKKQGYDTTLEEYVPSIQQRPDVLVRSKTHTLAFEYQCASLSLTEWQRRTTGFKRAGIIPIWIRGATSLGKRKRMTQALSSLDQAFFYQLPRSPSITLYAYCSDTERFILHQHPYPLSSTRALTTVSSHKLHSLSLSTLLTFTRPLHVESYFHSIVLSRKKWRSMRPNQNPNSKENQWFQWLYLKGYHPSLLPSICCIPVLEHEWGEPNYVWQSRLVLDELDPIQIGGVYSYFHSNKKKTGVIHYMDVLCRLKIFERVEGGYVKRKPIVFPECVPHAYEQDEALNNKLCIALF